MKCYSHFLEPINGHNLWEKVEGENIQPPKFILSKRGRRTTQRRREEGEPRSKHGKIRRTGKKMKCSNCGTMGHNNRTCPSKRVKLPVERKKKTNQINVPDCGEAETEKLTSATLSGEGVADNASIGVEQASTFLEIVDHQPNKANP